MKKVNQIVKSLSKIIVQLEKCVKNCNTEISDCKKEIARVSTLSAQAQSEQDHAVRIRDKLKELIK